jgi:hypothetical protein
MTYTEQRIAKKMAENADYRVAFEEEDVLFVKEQEQRQEPVSDFFQISQSESIIDDDNNTVRNKNILRHS